MSLYPKAHTLCVPLSFEANLQALQNVRFGERVLITAVKAVVTKALAATDAGTIAISNAALTAIGTVSIPLSSALESEHTVVIPANTVIERDSYLSLDPVKTTNGGSVNFYIQYQVIGK